MPRQYRGKPSKGCEPCRTRRVRCDETKPKCQKCVKAGHDCQYRNLLDLAFHNENSEVAIKAQNTWRQRSKLSKTPESTPSISPSPSSEATLSPGPFMVVDLHEIAVNRWFYDYSIPTDSVNPNRGILDYVPSIYSKSGSPSCLHAAVSAVAYANFCRRSKMSSEEVFMLGKAFYGEALTLVSKATQNEVLARSDEVIMAVYALGIYEIMSTGGDNPQFWKAHTRGLATLLKLRPLPRLEDGYTFRLFHTINMQVLSSCLRLGIESYLPLDMLRDYYDCPFPMVQLTGLLHHGVDLLAKWKGLTNTASVDQYGEAELTLQQIFLLDAELAHWELNLPLFFHYESHPTPEFQQPFWLKEIANHRGAPPIMYVYDSLQTAHGWNQYRVLRIMLNKAIMSAQNCNNINLTYRTVAVGLLERLVNDICVSVLAHFLVSIPGKPTAVLEEEICGIRAYFIAAPLTEALGCLRTFPNQPGVKLQAEWVDSVLGFLARAFHKRLR